MNHKRILCVEHRPQDLLAIVNMLELAGYEVVPAVSGRQALQMVSTSDFDGVLIEFLLGDSDSGDLRDHIQDIFPTIPVFVFHGTGGFTSAQLKVFNARLRHQGPSFDA